MSNGKIGYKLNESPQIDVFHPNAKCLGHFSVGLCLHTYFSFGSTLHRFFVSFSVMFVFLQQQTNSFEWFSRDIRFSRDEMTLIKKDFFGNHHSIFVLQAVGRLIHIKYIYIKKTVLFCYFAFYFHAELFIGIKTK